MYHQVLIAGFGGQGVLSCGQVLALAAMIEGKHVTWMPSYGPEQRGGTARCVVTVSDRPIGSPLAEKLSAALIFNQPSLVKFLPQLSDGSVLLVNSCMVKADAGCARHHLYEVPADTMARKEGLIKSGNIIMLGSYIAAGGVVSIEAAHEAVAAHLEKAKPHLIEVNRKALAAGYRFVQELWGGPEGMFKRTA
jgi:2-oxoglutarate ferredoxin oxidoreductase subunit gamma